MDDVHEVVLGDPEVTWDGRARSPEEARTALEAKIRHVHENGFGMMAAIDRANGEFLGYAGLQRFEDDRQIELGYYFGRRAWGRGIATEVARAFMEHAFGALQLEEVVAVVRPDNHASKRVLEKAGLRYERMAHHYDADVEFWSARAAESTRIAQPRT